MPQDITYDEYVNKKDAKRLIGKRNNNTLYFPFRNICSKLFNQFSPSHTLYNDKDGEIPEHIIRIKKTPTY